MLRKRPGGSVVNGLDTRILLEGSPTLEPSAFSIYVRREVRRIPERLPPGLVGDEQLPDDVRGALRIIVDLCLRSRFAPSSGDEPQGECGP